MASKSKKLLKVIEGVRTWSISTSVINQGSSAFEIGECLKSENFQVGQIAVHGFPHRPKCLAIDPIQKLIAVGTKTGSIRIFGRPGVDYLVKHPSSSPVLQIIFLINEGGLVSICQDDVVHLWTIRQKTPELVHSLQFKREHLTCGHVPVRSHWLYLGTDKGNVHVINVQQFTTSGYVINWNKAIDISQNTHPGRVIQVGENPQDPNKLLIAYSSGLLVVWDLPSKSAEARFKYSDNVNGFCWHWDGRQFMTCHNFGLLATWSCRQSHQPTAVICPSAGGDTVPEDCSRYTAIQRVEWLPAKSGEPFIIFTGGDNGGTGLTADSGDVVPGPSSASGLPNSSTSEPESGSRLTVPSLKVRRGKRIVVMQLEHPLIDFTSMSASPYLSETMDPYAIVVLQQNDLVVVDLLSPNYATFENPYPMNLHIPPVTCCLYFVDCPSDLIPASYAISSRAGQRRTGDGDTFSSRDWPIAGGESGQSSNTYAELLVTGHSDGSIRFWDASEMTLTQLCKIRTLKFFASAEALRPPTSSSPSADDVNANFSRNLLDTEVDPYAIRLMHFCPDSRRLLTASATHVCLLHFSKREQQYEIPVIDVNMTYECLDDYGSPDAFVDDQTHGTVIKEATTSSRNAGSVSSAHSAFATDRDVRVFVAVRPGLHSWPPGYQPSLICRSGVPSLGSDPSQACDPTLLPPPSLTSISLNSAYNIIAMGNEYGFALINYLTCVCILTVSTSELCVDLTNRVPNRSPGRATTVLTVDGKVSDKHPSPARPPPPKRPAPPHPQSRPPVCEAPTTVAPLGTTTPMLPLPASSFDQPKLSTQAACCCCCFTETKTSEPLSQSVLIARPKSPDSLVRSPVVSPIVRCPSYAVDTGESAQKRPKGHDAPVRFHWAYDLFDLRSVSTCPFKLSPVHIYGQHHSTCKALLSVTPLCAASVCACSPTRTPREKWSEIISPSQRHSTSASTSSLEQITSEGVRTFAFMECQIRKKDSVFGPSLWLGTSRGNILATTLNTREQSRLHHYSNAVIPTGCVYRLQGEIILISFLDSMGSLLPNPSCKWEDIAFTNPNAASSKPVEPSSDQKSENNNLNTPPAIRQGDQAVAARRLGTLGDLRTSKEAPTKSTSRTSSSSTSSSGPPGPSSTGHAADLSGSGPVDAEKYLVVICSEKQACVMALPTQICLSKVKITETSHVVRASVQRLRPPTMAGDTSSMTTFLACYLANGHFLAFSLPSLRMLMDVDQLPLTEHVSHSFAFGQYGQAVYLTTPSELLKITWSVDTCSNLRDMQGDLFVPCAMPDPPKKNFILTLLSGNLQSSLDRNELFSEANSGKAAVGTSTLLPNTRMDKVTGQATSATSEVARARNAAIERGEKLQQLDVHTQEMADQSKSLGRTAALLAAKFEKKDKRWGWPL